MNNMRNKILSLLVLLLTAASGAWAEETPIVTITFDSNGPVYSVEGLVTLTGTNYNLGSSSGVYFWSPSSPTKTLSATVEAVADNVSISKVVFRSLMVGGNDVPLEDTEKPFVCYANADKGGRSLSETDWTGQKSYERIAKIEVYTGPAEAPITVDWNASTKTGTFTMPAFDVELTPLYAPEAKWATDGDKILAPTAAEGVIAGTEDAIVKAGTVAQGQGTVMYFATTDAEMTAEKAAAADGWLSTLPTAAGYDGAQTVYVWYYIKGADTPQGQTATAENTFNDTEICAEPIKVEVLSNKFDIALKAANANTIEAGKATVKVGEAAAEVKEGKLTGVKMGSKVTITAKEGYKFRKAEGKKTGPAIWDGDLAKLTNESTEEFATATDGMTITGTLTANVKVSIADGATITFDNATINGVNNESYKWAGITCLGDATIILKDGTTNKVKGFFKRYPGIQPGPSGKTLIIKGGTAGTGTLEASSSQWGPGIGGENATCGNIEIQGGVITAKGDNGAAGIGSGHARCGNITISGGTVKATGGSYGAGIGSGNGNGETQICGDIVISGGTIEATGGSEGAGIGSGSGGVCGTVTITSGVTSVKATKGDGAPNSIGRGYSGKCGTVTIGGVEGAISTSPYTYQPGN